MFVIRHGSLLGCEWIEVTSAVRVSKAPRPLEAINVKLYAGSSETSQGPEIADATALSFLARDVIGLLVDEGTFKSCQVAIIEVFDRASLGVACMDRSRHGIGSDVRQAEGVIRQGIARCLGEVRQLKINS